MNRLKRFLMVKSLLEALFASVLAVGFYLSAFPPYFRGAVDETNAERVTGWAVNEAAPGGRVEVQLYLDGQFVAYTVADKSRPDVPAAGRAPDEWCGFRFDGPFILGPGPHEARVYALHESGNGARRTLQLIGKPLLFNK